MVAVVRLEPYRGERLLKSRVRDDALVEMDDTRSLPAFNLVLEGMSIGETREMPVRYPETHDDPLFAGKEIRFRITLKGLRKRVVPDLDDAFAAAGGAENLEALRARVRQRLQETANEVANQEVRDQLLEYVVSRSQVDFPEALVAEATAALRRDRERELQEHGLTLEDLARSRDTDLEGLEREWREATARHLRTRLVLEELAEKENITCTDEDLEAEIQRLAHSSGRTPDQVRAQLDEDGSLQSVRFGVITRKVLDYLLEHARVSEE
jgi:trigger factor